MRFSSRLAPPVALACVALVGTGCSASTDSAQVRTVTVERTAQAPTKSPSKQPATAARASAFKQCDANIEVRSATTTCEFAQNVFWTYWTEGKGSPLSVYSPALGASLDTSCSSSGVRVVCTTPDRGLVRFTQAAVASYSSSQAARYAATHDLGPDANESGADTDTDLDAGSASQDSDEEPGENIPNYDEGRGDRVQCNDGMYSQSGGIQGACSGHGGVAE